tara:strand:- start:5 stop:610 length:606 start_codon:yes stop_codon:yes gene_type:complete
MKFLFDLGGVFFDWDPKYFFKDIILDPKELEFFLTHVCNNAWNIQQDAGRTIGEAENEIILKFPNYKKQIKMYYSNHRRMIKGVFLDSIEVLNQLKSANYYCYVLSNWSAETFKGMKDEYAFLNQFDGMIISGEDKLIKPNSAIYQLAINRFDLDPETTVFIDDKLENVQAAKKNGFKIIHLIDPTKIKKEINFFLENKLK